MTSQYHCSPCRCSRRGFTLIELVVAMSILGLLMAMGFGLMRLGAQSWNKVNSLAENVAEIEAVQNLLRRELVQAYPEVSPAGNSSEISFTGDLDSVIFKAPLPAALGPKGPVEMRLYIAAGHPAGKQLVMAWRQNTDASSWQESVLLTGINHARWSYYGLAGEMKQAGWQPSWQRKTVLPQAIRLDIAFSAGDTRLWPLFIVAPKISMDTACVYDPVTKGCRSR